MKILIVSDTHKSHKNLDKVLEIVKPIDMLIHLGDVEGEDDYIQALGRGADIVMYGHTHKPSITREDDLITLNPGSLSYPRQEGRRPSYMLMEIDQNGHAEFTVNYL